LVVVCEVPRVSCGFNEALKMVNEAEGGCRRSYDGGGGCDFLQAMLVGLARQEITYGCLFILLEAARTEVLARLLILQVGE